MVHQTNHLLLVHSVVQTFCQDSNHLAITFICDSKAIQAMKTEVNCCT